jgi:hypothetical protein
MYSNKAVEVNKNRCCKAGPMTKRGKARTLKITRLNGQHMTVRVRTTAAVG